MASGCTTRGKRSVVAGWLMLSTTIRSAARRCLVVISRPPSLPGISDLTGVQDFVQGRRDTGLGLVAGADRRTGVVKLQMTKIDTNAIIAWFYVGAGLPVSFVSAHAG